MDRRRGSVGLEDFLRDRNLTNLKIDAAGTYGCYFDYSLDREANCSRTAVHLLELESFRSRKLDLPFEPDDAVPRDGNLLLKRIAGDNTSFHMYNVETASVETVMSIPFAVKDFAFGDFGIFFTAEIRHGDSTGTVGCSGNFPFYQEGRGIVGSSVKGLFGSGPDGKDSFLITSPDMDVEQVDFDIAGGRILFNAFTADGFRPVESALYLYDIAEKKLTLLCDRPIRIGGLKSMSGSTVLFTGVNLEEQNRNDNQQLYRLNVKTGECGVFGSFMDRSNEHPSVVTDSWYTSPPPMQRAGDYLYLKCVERDREVLCRIGPDGGCETIETGMSAIGCFHVLDKGILLIGLEGLKLSELYFHGEGALRQLSHHNPRVEQVRLSEPDRITERIDGVDIDGYVYPPADVREGERYPAVLLIHGGPKMMYSGVYSHDIQLLCAQGYYVFCCNPMGSDGRGNSFLNIRGRFADLPFEQLLAFTERVIQRYPLIDAGLLGVGGGSYGGYMTNYIISHTALFRAAVSERSISSLMTAFTSSDIGYQFIYEYLGNRPAPWTAPMEAMEASPVYKADKVTTPTLFIHGKDDYRCHYSESLNMYGALKYHGVESRLCLFEGENHGLSVRGRPRSRLRRYEEMLNWFDMHLKKTAPRENR
jgi:acetyl esterase/lipase